MASLVTMATISAVTAGLFVYATEDRAGSTTRKADRIPQTRTVPSEPPRATAPIEIREQGTGETRRPVRIVPIERRMAGFATSPVATILT